MPTRLPKHRDLAISSRLLVAMVARAQPGVGDAVGRDRIDARLGEGAVGVVYRAHTDPGGDVVALKLLKELLASDETFRARFVHEARAARHVEHDHVVAGARGLAVSSGRQADRSRTHRRHPDEA